MRWGILFLAILLVGCNTQKRQIRQLDGLALQQQQEFTRLSDLINPCFTGKAKSDTVITHDTTITAGETVTKYHTENDTVWADHNVTHIKTVTNKVTIHDTIPDTRKIASLQAAQDGFKTEAITASTQLKDAQQQAKNRLYIIIALSLIMAGSLALKIWGKI